MPNTKSFVIVGAGMAGARAAETLRSDGFEDRIFLIGDEGRLPYERPPLSKECLVGTKPVEVADLRAWEDWMDMAVHLVMNDRVGSVDTFEGAVVLSSGLRIRADKVLLATGGVAKKLNVPGMTLAGVHTLRTVDDCEALGDRLRRGRLRVTVVGGGFLAAEVASAACTLGNDVTWIDRARVPLTGTVGGHTASELSERYANSALTVMSASTVASIDGIDAVTGVTLDSGVTVPTDVVLVAIGQHPSLGYLDRAQFGSGRGLPVDERLESAVPGVFAAGDVANFVDPYTGGRTRHGTWMNAQNQGRFAARAMMGSSTAYCDVPWCWSDHFGINVQIAGRVDETADIVERRHASGAVSTFYVDGDRLVGAVGVDAQRDIRAAMLIMERGSRVDREALADSTTDLRRLGKEPVA